MTSSTDYPPGWDEARVRRVLEHFESQADEEAVAEDEAAFEATTDTAMTVPVDLVPTVRELISRHRRSDSPLGSGERFVISDTSLTATQRLALSNTICGELHANSRRWAFSGSDGSSRQP
jgi:hypothetical protein